MGTEETGQLEEGEGPFPRDEVELIGSMFQVVPEAFVVYDLAGKPLVWNKAYSNLVDCSDDEVRERMAWDFHPPEDVEFVARTFYELLQSGHSEYIEVGVKTRTGEVIPCGLSGTALKNGAGEIIALCGVGRDLRQLKRAAAIYGMVLRGAPDGFTVSTTDGTFLEVNDAFCEMLGYDRKEILGMKVVDVEADKTAPAIAEQLIRIMAQGQDRFETRLRRKDHTVIDIEASVSYENVDGGRLYAFVRDSTGRKRIEDELREHRDNLKGLVAERTRELEALNAQLVHEIEERELAESKLLRVNEELEAYAQTVSHEIRTPLAGISLALEYLERLAASMSPGGLDSEMAAIVQGAKRAVSTTDAQVERLLRLARAGQVPDEVMDVDISAVVSGLAIDLRDELDSAGATIVVPDDLGVIRADPLQIRQVFSNLLLNALRHCEAPSPMIQVSRLEGPGNRFLFRDNGVGLAPEITGDLSDPVNPGSSRASGLGLAIIGRVVRVYGGTIKAYNDDGACFEFVLNDYER